MSLAHSEETVALLLPYLNSFSGLPTALMRYEPQLRGALEALNYDHRSLAGVAATLRDAHEFQQWFRERQSRGF
jgi:hypothetical protein